MEGQFKTIFCRAATPGWNFLKGPKRVSNVVAQVQEVFCRNSPFEACLAPLPRIQLPGNFLLIFF
jgi:hypothetical protein